MAQLTIQQALQLAAELLDSGQYPQAQEVCRQILQAQPEHPGAMSLLGGATMLAGDIAPGIELLTRAVQLDPHNAAYRGNLARVLFKANRVREAIDLMRSALQLDPAQAENWFALGLYSHTCGDLPAAIDAYTRAIGLAPAHASALGNLAAALCDLGRPADALDFGRRAVAGNPNDPSAHNNLAVAHAKLGKLSDSITHFRRSIELDPNQPAVHGQLAYTMLHHPDISMEEIYQEHLRWAASHAAPVSGQIARHANDRSAGRKLRVGYVSPNFGRHAVAYFSLPMLEAHDHSRFEVICYNNSSAPGDEITARFKRCADLWRDIAGIDDRQFAELVRQDRINILVDLSGHLPRNRLLAFALKPAPVQVTYLGYQTTTGLATMDYRLTDAIADPPELDTGRFYTEKLVRLPVFFVYQPYEDSPAVSPSPADGNGHITFGSFNNPVKVTPVVHAAWARVMREVPDSRLHYLIPGGDVPANAHIRESFAAHGISRDRIDLLSMRPTREYLELFNDIDVALDPFPFGGHTTTCDALWMGVPTIVLAGKHYVSRMGASVMHQIDCDRLVAANEPEYVEKLVSLACDRARLAELRRTLRPRLQASPALDARQFTANLERAYETMFADWCAKSEAAK